MPKAICFNLPNFFPFCKSSRWFRDAQNLIVEQSTSLQDIILRKQVLNVLLHESSAVPIFFSSCQKSHLFCQKSSALPIFFPLAKTAQSCERVEKMRVDNMLLISIVKSHLLCQFFFLLCQIISMFLKSSKTLTIDPETVLPHIVLKEQVSNLLFLSHLMCQKPSAFPIFFSVSQVSCQKSSALPNFFPCLAKSSRWFQQF